MTLNWSPPKDDGGAPIISYTIEVKDQFSTRWRKLAKDVKETIFEVTGLTKGDDYQYRVIAENKAGLGEPSNSSQSVTASFAFSKWKLKIKNLVLWQLKNQREFKLWFLLYYCALLF